MEMHDFLETALYSTEDVFHFCYNAMSHPELLFLPVEEAVQIVQTWLEETDRVWSDLPGCKGKDDESSQEDFIGKWADLQTHGAHLTEKALALSEQTPPHFDRKASRTDRYYRFLAYTHFIQQMRGEQPAILPTSTISELFGMSEKNASRYRQWAIEDGYLVELEKHIPGKKATRFRYIPPASR